MRTPRMPRLFSLGIVSLLLGATMMTASSSSDRIVYASRRESFIGAWRLELLEEEGADGKASKEDCSGMLVYTRDGHMSVQVIFAKTRPGADAAVQYAENGYEASFGRYEIDERSGSFTYHVEGALVRSLIGKDLTRIYEFAGNQLILKSSDPSEHWRAVWEHY